MYACCEEQWFLTPFSLPFNVFSTKDETFKSLERKKFEIPAELRGKYTNAKLDKSFDQMAFLAPSVAHQIKVARAGVFPFFDYIYRDEDRQAYSNGGTEKAYREWRTYKMSDHLPIWVELNVDFGKSYLKSKMELKK